MKARQTIQKQILTETLEELVQVKGHLSIDEIYNAVKEKYAAISKTTVYRIVRQLSEEGIIRKVRLEDGFERYDVNLQPHYHFTCSVCGIIYDVELDELKDCLGCLNKKYGFELEKTNLSFNGICHLCKEKVS